MAHPDTLVLLSRIQFGLTAAFHYLYPPMSIGLAVYLVTVEALYLKTHDPLWRQVARFWTRVFALTFAIGVATGLVMEFEFGTNWAAYSRFVGDVFGSALAAEGIFAFFLESGFLALLLFGWERLPPRVHFFSTLMVAVGAHFSAIWIVVANSWMQTPAGYHIVAGPNGPRAEITDFWALVFNPSSMTRLGHVVLGAWLAGAFLAMSVAAWYLLKERHQRFALASIRVASVVALAASLGQILVGHASVLYVAKYQPVKFAAMEGHYQTGPADITALGWVDEARGQVRGLGVPGLGSLLLSGNAADPVAGLNEVPPADRPPVQSTFQSFHAMAGVGFLLTAIALVAGIAAWRGTIGRQRALLWVLVFAVLGPQIGNQAGWMAAEIGRQPWIVQGLMRTAAAVSPVLVPAQVVFSIILFTVIYAGLFVVFIYLLNAKIQDGPDPIEDRGALLKLPVSLVAVLREPRTEL